jgi:hypothetical protein
MMGLIKEECPDMVGKCSDPIKLPYPGVLFC